MLENSKMKILSTVFLDVFRGDKCYSFTPNKEYEVSQDVGSYLLTAYPYKFKMVYDPVLEKIKEFDVKQSGNIIKKYGEYDEKLLWTIGICNYKSSIYLKTQIKSLYEFNKTKFNLIIVDNSSPTEFDELKNAVKNYKNAQIFVNSPRTIGAGRQHAEALSIIHQKTKTKYLMVMDPDFFWVRKNVLNILQEKIDEGNAVVGAPYHTVSYHDLTPAAWGCAYLTSFLESGDFQHLHSDLTKEDISKLVLYGKDTAWRIRDRINQKNIKTFAFDDKIGLPEWFPIKGSHSANFEASDSNEKISHEYMYEGRPIAYHLCRGSYEIDDDFLSAQDQNEIKVLEELIDIRERYSKFFYNMVKEDK